MATHEEFQAAAQRAQQLPTKPSNTVLLQLYSLYKQATEGDVTGSRPGGFDFTLAANFTDTEVTKTPTTAQLSGLNPAPVLFDRLNVLSEGTTSEGDVEALLFGVDPGGADILA